ncbi:YncE family protein [Pedobacter sp. SYSU D00535]|uniref:YncE family protein n=1 Tax=Pedobacter sp. SYSU D00535 TaxID=2810308 RepID=UPI001A96339C|nr:YncE family protein [Pedobacter sp. SYSU D00535]
MRIRNYFKATLAVAFVIGFASCRKDNGPEPEPEPVSQGVYVLSQGNFNQNNSVLSYYSFDSKAVTENYFGAANAGANLGDLGEDIEIYGSKMYISVNGSNKVEVVNAKTAKKIATVTINSPRSIAVANGKVFVSSYTDNVYAIDTTNLSVTHTIPVGKDPEGMAVVGNKLYVANSGGFEATFANTVSVIDLTTFTELKKITVGVNPAQVIADKYGDVYVVTKGNYAGIDPNLYVIKTTTDQAIALNIPATGLAISGDIAYIYKANYKFSTNSYDIGYLTLNVLTETPGSSFITDGTQTAIQLPYGIAVDPSSSDIYITDAKNFVSAGTVHCYSKEGKKKFSFDAAVMPAKLKFYTK